MANTPKSNPDQKQKPRPKERGWQTYMKAQVTQLGVQVRLLNGKRQTWPYAQLVTHTLQGGELTIWFSQHKVAVRGRHLEEADEALHLQSLVYLNQNGVRRQEALNEPEIPEDQPAIDNIEITYIGD